MRKRIDLLAPPFSGHLHPILAMGRFLNKAYQVRVVSSKGAQKAIEAAGLCGVVINNIDDRELINIVNPPYAVGSNPIKLHQQFKHVLYILTTVYNELESLYQKDRPDLLIVDFTLPVGGTIASRMNIKWWTSLPSPCVLESAEGPPAYLGGLGNATNTYQKIRNAIGRKLIRLFKIIVFNLYRKEINNLGLNNLYRSDGSEAIYSEDKILCLGLSQLEFHKRWPLSVEFMGPMLYTPPTQNHEIKFLKNKKYILVTLGTHLQWRKDEVSKKIASLAKKFPDIIFHFSNGHSHSKPHRSKEAVNFERFDYIDYDKYLCRYDYVIHHGGAGIMYQCLRHGIASVVYPVDYDQFDHAARLSHAGLAIWVKNLCDFDNALQELIESETLESNCYQYQIKLTEKESQRDLVHLIDNYFSA
ncbi:glycosyltransferase [Agarilytica rhodophyticola]|uniref:glycosyltransferase n=1 Tax=Agarilytica rhodophyticola TaxID=1737490 RepID=UPI001C1FA988|nr:glycosyltransferase [Agarilytica rhodophyticola]